MGVLPSHLANRLHDDWPFPFKYIPRKWTAFDWGKPKLLAGNLEAADFKTVLIDHGSGVNMLWFVPKPISSPNTWQLSYYPGAPWYAFLFNWYVAYSFPRGKDGKFHQIRLGSRYDDVDDYTNCPTFPTARRYSGDDSQNTQDWK